MDTGSFAIIRHTIHMWMDNLIAFTPNMLASVLVLVVCYFVQKSVRRVGVRIAERFFSNVGAIVHVADIGVAIIFWFLAVVLVLNILHLASFVTHVLAGAGIVGIVAGFAFKDIASNAFAGLLIRSQQPFRIGDWVEIQGYIGEVEQLGLVGTGVKTYQGHLAYIPNQQIFNQTFINFSTFGKARIIIEVGVSYGDDLSQVKQVALDTVRALPMIIEPEEADFYVVGIGSSTYNCEIRFWVNFTERKDFLKARSAGIMAVKKAFEAADICVAYNVTTLDFGVKGGVNLFDKPVSVETATAMVQSGKEGANKGDFQ